FFRAPSLNDAWTVIHGIAFNSRGLGLASALEFERLGLDRFEVILGFGGALALWGAERINRDGWIDRVFPTLPGIVRWACYYACAHLILFVGKVSKHQFLYFQF